MTCASSLSESPRPFSVRKPSWLRMTIPGGTAYAAVRRQVDGHRLHTVCESAKCPNLGECWSHGTATFMILGNICTRSCGFCAIATGRPGDVDAGEPERVAEAVRLMDLRYAVITSVNRDELADGGAAIWAATLRAVRKTAPACGLETLIPDFKGSEADLLTVLEARPDVLNHNVETVPRLYRTVRPQAKYERSLELLARAKSRGFLTKSSLMLGFGEEEAEVAAVLEDLRRTRVDLVTIGQYLQPTATHLPVTRFVPPEEFAAWKTRALAMGFAAVESGPMVRSSYRAEQSYQALQKSSGSARDPAC